VRACRRNKLEEVGDGCEVGIAAAFVVERARANEVELRPMVRAAVNLPVVELD
jgi:hypothetical protein